MNAREQISTKFAKDMDKSKLRGVAMIHDGKKYSVVTCGTPHEVGQMLIMLVKHISTDIAENYSDEVFKQFAAGMRTMIRHDAMQKTLDELEANGWRGAVLWVSDTD